MDALHWNQTNVPLDLRKRIVDSWLNGDGNADQLAIRYKVSSKSISLYIDRYLKGYTLESEFEIFTKRNENEYHKTLDNNVLTNYLLNIC